MTYLFQGPLLMKKRLTDQTYLGSIKKKEVLIKFDKKADISEMKDKIVAYFKDRVLNIRVTPVIKRVKDSLSYFLQKIAKSTPILRNGNFVNTSNVIRHFARLFTMYEI